MQMFVVVEVRAFRNAMKSLLWISEERKQTLSKNRAKLHCLAKRSSSWRVEVLVTTSSQSSVCFGGNYSHKISYIASVKVSLFFISNSTILNSFTSKLQSAFKSVIASVKRAQSRQSMPYLKLSLSSLKEKRFLMKGLGSNWERVSTWTRKN
ncbi:hypothetical protein FGO68_gene10459 [Halteria grandinella]|uniref:Uncharacterized protein n=1 Tax=Halteria grandinella TaxID=5974 RepID=A0A8J8SYI5_HALGN|nr:hypothetical protein FGO68_gene10459 [Halteria grandinella]